MKLTRDIVARCIDDFPTCIECGNTYFHAPLCRHGLGLAPNELIRRLTVRAMQLTTEHKNLKCHCGSPVTGTAWVAYHNMTALLTVQPVCNEHSFFVDDRPHGYIHSLITDNIHDVWTIVAETNNKCTKPVAGGSVQPQVSDFIY